MKKSKLLIMACSLLLTAGLCSCGETTVPPTQDASETGLIVHEAGIKIKKLSTGTDTDGKPYIVVGYSVTPADTTHVHFLVDVDFQDANAVGTATDYVTATIDESAKTIKIKKVQDFNQIVLVTITDMVDTTKTASVEVHLKQKFLGWPAQLPGTHNPNNNGFEDVSEKWVYSQSSQTKWYGLNYEHFSPHSYTGNGFSATYTDAMTTGEKAVSVSAVNVLSAKYYAVSSLSQTFHQTGNAGYYTSTYTLGSEIGDGTTNTQTISYVPEYGAKSPNFILRSSSDEAKLVSAVRIDTASWTNEQKVAMAAAEGIALKVIGTLNLKIGDTTSTGYPFMVTFVAANSDYYNYIADYVPLTNVMVESPTVTF